MSNLISKLLKEQSENRFNPEKTDSVDVEYKKFNKSNNSLTWDENKND